MALVASYPLATRVLHAFLTQGPVRSFVSLQPSLWFHKSSFKVHCNCRPVRPSQELTVTSGKLISHCIFSLHLCSINDALINKLASALHKPVLLVACLGTSGQPECHIQQIMAQKLRRPGQQG
jgi:hypothetical protein